MSEKYDSTWDVRNHIDHVRDFILDIIRNLYHRAIYHDASKLLEPEKSGYDEFKPKISKIESIYGYGSDEYEKAVKDFMPTLEFHFRANRHHPEHFENGIDGMTLVDVVEMLTDWKAASIRSGHALNLEVNRKRFGISDQLYKILENTCRELGW